jgi:uncharacterized protein (DUF2336 family)
MPMSQDRSASPVEASRRRSNQPLVRVKTDTAKHVGALLSAAALTDAERETALAIIEKLVRDVDQEVREALAIHVARCAILPPTLARRIAEDVEAVALPFIRVSPALSDADLIAIISSGGDAKWIAVAKRPSVSGGVSNALIGTGSEIVVTALLQNDGAVISEPGYHGIMDGFGENPAVQGLMAERPSLPLTVTERLIQIASEGLRARLVEKHALPPVIVAELLRQARERALLHGAVALPRAFDVDAFVHRLAAKGELTPTLLMRTLCLGDVRFFEVGMAVLAGIAVPSAVELIADQGPLGFKALYEKTGLPSELFRAFKAALEVLGEMKIGDHDGWSPAQAQAILDRMLREYDEACPADLEHLMSQISRGMLGSRDRQSKF